MDPLRILIADDDSAMRLALGEIVTRDPSLELVGVARDAHEAIRLAEEAQPHVAVLDVTMPAGGGPRAAREIRRMSPATHVIALSGHQDHETVVEMLRAGATGYLVKPSSSAEVLVAIRRTAEGEGSLSAEVTGGVVGELADHLVRAERAEEHLDAQVNNVRRILDEHLIAMVFQPIVELETGRVIAFEALARFPLEPRRTPDLWFGDAAAVGLGADLELAALRAAAAHMPAMPAEVSLAVNLSPQVAFCEGFLEMLDGLPAERLIVEITEHAPVEDYEAAGAGLDMLRARGVRIAIDDAGAGFASLRHILRFAPDIIKLDLDLTRHVETNHAVRALTSALISFGQQTGAVIVAEGIETEAELEVLRALGASHGQGYYLGRPEPLSSGGS